MNCIPLLETAATNKTMHHIKNIPDSFLAHGGNETGFGKTIPFWLFGLLY